jgi:NifU-like protein involved in Fe-S cluster formation
MLELTATGDNPLCGDAITVAISIEDQLIVDAHWHGYGCELCLGTADRLLEEVKGRSIGEAAAITLEELLGWYGTENIGWMRRECVHLPLKVIHAAFKLQAPMPWASTEKVRHSGLVPESTRRRQPSDSQDIAGRRQPPSWDY